MRLRAFDDRKGGGAKKSQHQKLRMPPRGNDPLRVDKTRRCEKIQVGCGISDMGEYDSTLRTAISKPVLLLRRQGDNSLCALAHELRKFPCRYGAKANRRAFDRSHRCERQLRARQLPLGDTIRAGPEHSPSYGQGGKMIFALDLGQRCGFAFGCPGERPISGAWILKRKDEKRRVAAGNLIAILNDTWASARPSIVVKEAPLPLQAFSERGNSESGVVMAYGLHVIVEGMCERFGLRLEEAHPSTIRRHFIGIGRLGSRKETKGAVVRRCRMLGLVPDDCYDEDRCDAVATHDWACATHGRRSVSTESLVLFEQRERHHGRR